MIGAHLEPTDAGLELQHRALQQQGSIRAVGLGQPRPLDVAQPAQQLPTLCVGHRTGSASPAAATAISLRWNSAGAGFGQSTSTTQATTRSVPAAVSSYTLRSGRTACPTWAETTRPLRSSRVSVTYTWPALNAAPNGPSAACSRCLSSYPWDGPFASSAKITSCMEHPSANR